MSAASRGLLLASLFGFAVHASTAAELHPLSSDAVVAGKPVSDYPVLWWQWVNLMRYGAQAFQDPTGAQCAINQFGPVWFLAGTDGTEEVRRSCVVPLGKHLFLPIITMLVTSTPGVRLSCEQAKAQAAANNDHLVKAVVEIDGQLVVQVERLRMASKKCFDAYPELDEPEKPGAELSSATDGYWLMLEPLSAGEHTIRVNARYLNPGATYGDLEQVFEYQLTVQEGESPPARPRANFSKDVVAN